MNMFVENNIPINTLYINATNADTTQNIPTLKTLKHLDIRESLFHNISDDCVYNLIESQTALEYISIKNADTETTQRIIKTLEFGFKKNISKFRFHLYEIDLETYNTILNLAKNCIKVEIKSGKIDIPKKVLDANEKWLHVVDWLQDTSDFYLKNEQLN